MPDICVARKEHDKLNDARRDGRGVEVPPQTVQASGQSIRGGSLRALEDLRRVIRQPRPLASLQRDVARVRPALEAIDDVRQSR